MCFVTVLYGSGFFLQTIANNTTTSHIKYDMLDRNLNQQRYSGKWTQSNCSKLFRTSDLIRKMSLTRLSNQTSLVWGLPPLSRGHKVVSKAAELELYQATSTFQLISHLNSEGVVDVQNYNSFFLLLHINWCLMSKFFLQLELACCLTLIQRQSNIARPMILPNKEVWCFGNQMEWLWLELNLVPCGVPKYCCVKADGQVYEMISFTESWPDKLISPLGYSSKHFDCIIAKGFFYLGYQLNLGPSSPKIGLNLCTTYNQHTTGISSVYDQVKREHLHVSAMEPALVLGALIQSSLLIFVKDVTLQNFQNWHTDSQSGSMNWSTKSQNGYPLPKCIHLLLALTHQPQGFLLQCVSNISITIVMFKGGVRHTKENQTNILTPWGISGMVILPLILASHHSKMRRCSYDKERTNISLLLVVQQLKAIMALAHWGTLVEKTTWVSSKYPGVSGLVLWAESQTPTMPYTGLVKKGFYDILFLSKRISYHKMIKLLIVIMVSFFCYREKSCRSDFSNIPLLLCCKKFFLNSEMVFLSLVVNDENGNEKGWLLIRASEDEVEGIEPWAIKVVFISKNKTSFFFSEIRADSRIIRVVHRGVESLGGGISKDFTGNWLQGFISYDRSTEQRLLLILLCLTLQRNLAQLSAVDMQHAPEKMPQSPHVCICRCFGTVTVQMVAVTTEASWEFLHVNFRQVLGRIGKLLWKDHGAVGFVDRSGSHLLIIFRVSMDIYTASLPRLAYYSTIYLTYIRMFLCKYILLKLANSFMELLVEGIDICSRVHWFLGYIYIYIYIFAAMLACLRIVASLHCHTKAQMEAYWAEQKKLFLFEKITLHFKRNLLHCLQLTCRKSQEASVVTPAILQKLFNQASMHSHCAFCTVTVLKHLHMKLCGVSMAVWLEHAACQLQAVERLIFAGLEIYNHQIILFQ
ncbi:putative signal peptide protein [Puccinia sorghi]|uniref:Putative signal peptide protein n=1 Tax=Puccinia sorghi TaxID=27349 RepID=A0A0L6V2U9_9BASI|nr:putative signal peptide protein [Puccinia sorghi]